MVLLHLADVSTPLILLTTFVVDAFMAPWTDESTAVLLLYLVNEPDWGPDGVLHRYSEALHRLPLLYELF